jgi:hypothetical protein
VSHRRWQNAWGHNWGILSQGAWIQGPGPPGCGLDVRLITCSVKNSIVVNSKVKTGCNLVESSKDGHGSKRGCSVNDNDDSVRWWSNLDRPIPTQHQVTSRIKTDWKENWIHWILLHEKLCLFHIMSGFILVLSRHHGLLRTRWML